MIPMALHRNGELDNFSLSLPASASSISPHPSYSCIASWHLPSPRLSFLRPKVCSELSDALLQHRLTLDFYLHYRILKLMQEW
jgi:hypothetical protein